MAGTVLIVETNPAFRQSLAHWLADSGFRSWLARDGLEAEQIARKEEFEVAIIGLLGLEREGLSLLRSIKELHPFTQVILIASRDQLHLSIEGMKLGAFDDLRPPIDGDLLLSRVRDAFRVRKRNLRVGRKSIRKRFQDLFVAATFAEAGEFDAVKGLLQSKKEESGSGKSARDKHDTRDSATGEEDELS
jgi:DNA-binding response OmpR family regulator